MVRLCIFIINVVPGWRWLSGHDIVRNVKVIKNKPTSFVGVSCRYYEDGKSITKKKKIYWTLTKDEIIKTRHFKVLITLDDRLSILKQTFF